MLTYTATEARAALPAIIDFVTEGEEITTTRHGRPVAVVLSPQALRRRRATEAMKLAEDLRQRLDSIPPMTRLPDSGMTIEEADARVAEIYAERGIPLTDAFDADVLIYAAIPGFEPGQRVAHLFSGRIAEPDVAIGVGSTLLLPEVLIKPLRLGRDREFAELGWLLEGLELHPADRVTVDLALGLGVRYGLAAVDAIHLATAVQAGADRFITNNRRDFPTSIAEIDVVYPDSLPEPAA